MTDTTQVPLKKTLNLPKTAFPMKANLAQNEPQTLKAWQKEKMYHKVLEKNVGKPAFVFHDGPPYANGNIHIGHLLNKVLKDIVVRSQNLMGKHCPFTPGWDCHGLPIEHKVMTEMFKDKPDLLDGKSVDDAHLTVRYACAKYAKKYIKLQAQQMQQLLTMADYDNPYLTMVPHYEQRVLEVFSDLVKEGIVYRSLKPVHWSIANQTALADAELEYQDRTDISVFVNFNALNQDQIKNIFDTQEGGDVSFVIWTTTPWTLPANLAVAVHENYDYALVKNDGRLLIVAEGLIEKLKGKALSESCEVLGKVKGSALVGLSYQHPFCDRQGKVATADYVTLEDGTGLVHTAPGHGVEDYQTGLKEGLEVYCPVQGDGTYDTTVPEWLQGKLIWDANKEIVSHLEKSGNLLFQQDINHSYPHDWRSKTPVIFRSTYQWFISVDKALKSGHPSLRAMALNAIEKDINFVPSWGQNRLRGMMESRPDWCISRQRSWGLPIPAFTMANGEIFMTESSVIAVSKIFGEKGSDMWFKMTPAELLQHYNMAEDAEAPEGLDLTGLEKMYDIFDVWFESGSSWHAVLNHREQGYPADLYLEGSDQHRGWFHLSLLPALGVTQQSPFKSVLTHGFIVDKDGMKMSKSSGNALSVEDLVKKYGAEVTRWWASSLAFENDVKVDLSYFDVAGDAYRKIRNTLRFLLSNIPDLEVNENTIAKRDEVINNLEESSINSFALEKLSELIKNVEASYKGFKFKQVNALIYQFCQDTLSSLYCSATKDRLYCDHQSSARRQETQYTIWVILEGLCRVLAPILPHTAQEAFAALYNGEGKSIHLTEWLSPDYKAAPQWESVLQVRNRVLKALEEKKKSGLENSLDAGVILFDEGGALQAFKKDLADLFGVSRVSLTQNEGDCDIEDLRQELRCERSWKRDETVKERESGVPLSDRDWEAVKLFKGA